MKVHIFLLFCMIEIHGQRLPSFSNFTSFSSFPSFSTRATTTSAPNIGFPNVQYSKDPQCSCVKPTGSSTCLQYNPEYQAATFDEAAANFVDLTSPTPKSDKNPDCPKKPKLCNCIQMHLERGSTLKATKARSPQDYTHSFHRIPDHQFETREWTYQELVNHCERYIDIHKPWAPDYGQPWDVFGPDRFRESTYPRSKRQTTSPYTNVYNVDCRKKGQPVTDGSNLCGLCDICWQWGVLGSDYFPQYVNQMGCGNETRCLSGYGKCVQRFRAISVLRNFGTAFQPDWREYTLNVPVVCDCQITQNSAISGLVLN